MEPWKLCQYAEQRGHRVCWYRFSAPVGSLSVQLETGRCAIAIDPFDLTSSADEAVKLAHELGHCETGSFYNRYAARDLIQKHENRADRWAIRRLIPEDALDTAVAAGYTALWQLADYFGVTEPFMQKALCLYCNGNLAVDAYYGSAG